MVWSRLRACLPAGRPIRPAAAVAGLRAAIVLASAVAAAPAQGQAETLLLEFTTPGCLPCQEMHPVLLQLSQAGFACRQIDAASDPHTTSQFGVNQFPTFIAVAQGREHGRIIGKTTFGELARMLRDASAATGGGDARAASPPPRTPGGGPRVDVVNPFASRTPDVPPATEAGAAEPTMSAAQVVASTVRLRLRDGGGASTGTGTVVDVRQGHALILTCGHLFRETSGEESVEVTFFQWGPQGAVESDRATGRVLAFDVSDGHDLGLVHVAIDRPATALRVASPQAIVQRGERVVSAGCNHGDAPTLRLSHVTHVNRYRGGPNVEAAGAPVEGRSGGGLFNERGELIGVCFAADPADDEGLYASSAAICALLDEKNLSFVYRQPPADAAAPLGPPADSLFAADRAPSLVRGQGPAVEDRPALGLPRDFPRSPAANGLQAAGGDFLSGPAPPDGDAPSRQTAPSPLPEDQGLSAAEQATLEEIRRRSAQAEVICIIRPLTPDGACDVIKVNKASPAFLRQLTGELNRTATDAVGTTPTLGPR